MVDSPIDLSEKSGKMSLCKESKDSTFVLTLNDEKLLKRLRQVGSGLFYVVVLDGVPVMLFVGGKIEVLGKFQS